MARHNLSLARKLGLEGEVQQAIQAVALRLFSEASVTVGFAGTGNSFAEVRYQLGRAIAAAGEWEPSFRDIQAALARPASAGTVSCRASSILPVPVKPRGTAFKSPHCLPYCMARTQPRP